MPGYYAQPSSVEQAMFGMKRPYDLMNMQNEGNMMAGLLGQNWYTPDPTYGPSPFDAFMAPFLNIFASGAEGYMEGQGGG